MSFATKVKDELCKDVPEDNFELHALLYGFLVFSHRFNEDEINFSVEHEPTARLFAESLALYCGISAKISFHERKRGTLYKVSIESLQDRRKIIYLFNHSNKETSLRINRANIETDECIPFFIRGAYLVCGSLTNPEKGYHLEFDINFMNLCKDFQTLISEVLFEPKHTIRRGSNILYYKESENIEDMLTFMGAPMTSLELMNIKIMKDIKNRVNRRMNCDNANMDKTLNASLSIIEDIKFVMNNNPQVLSEDLKKLALLRVDNPEMSLRELGECLDPTLSKSGVNHRLSKIIKIAKQLRKINAIN